MIEVDIPGRKGIKIKNVVFDFNGTMATDGILDKSIEGRMVELAKVANVYILSSDTYGTVQEQCKHLPLEVKVMSKNNGGEDKKNFVLELGKEETACVGNGANDTKMFEVAELSLIILGDEGCATKALMQSDLLTKDIKDALDLLLNKSRMIASLRE